jgi:hypothetical protein
MFGKENLVVVVINLRSLLLDAQEVAVLSLLVPVVDLLWQKTKQCRSKSERNQKTSRNNRINMHQ